MDLRQRSHRLGFRHFSAVIAFAVFGLAGPAASQAQITDLTNFDGTNASDPAHDLTLIGSTLYGVTDNGGTGGGAVFSVPVGGGAATILGALNVPAASYPQGSLTLSGGALYGVTASGGADDDGTVFSVPLGGGTVATIGSFSSLGAYSPAGGLTLIGGTFYGASLRGGATDAGSLCSVPLGGGTPTVLASFTSSTTGAYPRGNLTLSGDGTTFYGTTTYGGADNHGTVFSVPVSGGTITTLASFNGTGNVSPSSLILIGSTLYGTTYAGGASVDGTVYSLPVSGGSITTLASFTFNGTSGLTPSGGLTLSADGTTLFGVAGSGGINGDGTVFAVPVGGGAITDLASFNGTNGSSPTGTLVLSSDGHTLYGTTTGGGGPNQAGTVFSIPATDVAPEPGSAPLLLTGLLAMATRRRRGSH